MTKVLIYILGLLSLNGVAVHLNHMIECGR